eukprot:2164455-Rhodomonas_salina.1
MGRFSDRLGSLRSFHHRPLGEILDTSLRAWPSPIVSVAVAWCKHTIAALLNPCAFLTLTFRGMRTQPSIPLSSSTTTGGHGQTPVYSTRLRGGGGADEAPKYKSKLTRSYSVSSVVPTAGDPNHLVQTVHGGRNGELDLNMVTTRRPDNVIEACPPLSLPALSPFRPLANAGGRFCSRPSAFLPFLLPLARSLDPLALFATLRRFLAAPSCTAHLPSPLTRFRKPFCLPALLFLFPPGGDLLGERG